MPDDVTKAFLAGSLNPSRFDHQSHIRVAKALLANHSFLEAAFLYDRGIERLTKEAGIPERRSVTKTIAFLALIAETNEQPGRDVLARWYTPERLNSEIARDRFVMPDQFIESGGIA
jgi:hypothetical protein